MVQLTVASVLIGIIATGVTGMFRKNQSMYYQSQMPAHVTAACDNSINGSSTEDSFGFPWAFVRVKNNICMGAQRDFSALALIADIITWSVAVFAALTIVRKFA
jgi:hypothetical protein